MATEYRLPEEGADLPGSYNPDYVPYLWGIFHALGDDDVRVVVMMKAAQIGWTYGLIGFLGSKVATDPSSMIVLFPKDGAAREFADEKFTPAVLATPALREKIDVSTSRKSGNRALFKKFPGGFLKLIGSNSISNVKSTPTPLVIVEEPDDTNENVKDQGDAIRLARERLKRFRKGKLVLGGTPSVKGVSRVEEYTNLSDQRVLPVTCHDCGEQHVLDWDNVSWLTADSGQAHPVYGLAQPDTAIYSCPNCGSAWDDWQRQQNIINTVRAARDAGDPYCGWAPTVETTGGVVGFKELNELYVCIPGTSLADVVRDYLESVHDAEQGDVSGRIVFINSKLGRPYEYETEAPDIEELEARAENYQELTVPAGGLLLTAGIDVQHDRLAVEIWAWGRGEESWLLYWGELLAKTSTTDPKDPVWDALDVLLFTPRQHESGARLMVCSVSIDASDGSTSDQVYAWVRRRQKRGVMAIKGDSHDYGNREIYSLPRKIDHKRKTKASRHGLHVYMVGTHKAKDLLIGEGGRLGLRGSGAGRMHWYSGVRSDFYAQLTSEIKAPHRSLRGKMTWQLKSGVRNEALDCAVYALHAARAKRVHLLTPAQWDELEHRLKQPDLLQEVEIDDNDSQSTESQGNQRKSRRRKSGFVNGWK